MGHPGAAPVRSQGANALIHFTGGLTLTQNGGDNAYGVLARAGGRIAIDGATSVTLQNSGQSRRGVLALDAGSQITLADVTVTSSGAAAPRGLAAENGGKLSYRAARIDFQGDNGAYGMRQSHPGGSIVGGNTTIKVSGPASWGVQVDGPVHINGRLELDSADGIGLNLRNGGHIQIGANSEIKGTSGGAFHAANTAAASTTLNTATVTAQTLWNATGSDYTFAAQGDAYTGGAAGSSLILKLEGAAKWNLNANSTLKNMELAGNAELHVDGDYSLTPAAGESVKNTAGVIDLSDAATGDKLTINGKYEGSGGKLKLDVDLSAAAVADVLKVNGNVTGSTQIAVTQLPGTGVATTGNGILIAEISGTSPANAFTLPTPLISGSFQYAPQKVGNNW